MNPAVNVIMAVHNSQEYLHESVKSILEQTHENFELIIVNDASTDNSKSIIEDFLDKRIKIFDNKERIGLTKSLNIAIQYSKGEYIARMDADDIADPDRLKKQIFYAETHPQIGILGTSFYEIDENDKLLGEVYLPKNDEQIRKRIFRFNPFFHSSVVIPRGIFEKVGLYHEEFQYAQDYELWFRILEKYKGANLQDLLMKRRKHKGTLTQKNLQLQFHFAYRACLKGQEHIGYSFFDRFWILKYKVASKSPDQFVLLFNKLRPHNLKYYFSKYYKRDFR